MQNNTSPDLYLDLIDAELLAYLEDLETRSTNKGGITA